MKMIVHGLGFVFGALVFGYLIACLQAGRVRLRQMVFDRSTHPQPFWLCVGIGLAGGGLVMAIMGLLLVLDILG